MQGNIPVKFNFRSNTVGVYLETHFFYFFFFDGRDWRYSIMSSRGRSNSRFIRIFIIHYFITWWILNIDVISSIKVNIYS